MDNPTVAMGGAAFLLSGVVKGVPGSGMPLVAITAMSTALELRVAIPILAIPFTVTSA